MEARETPWWVITTCILPALLLGLALFTGQWGALLGTALVIVPPCVALVVVLALHQELSEQAKEDKVLIGDMLCKLGAERSLVAELTSRLEEQSRPTPTPKPVAPQQPPTQQAERDEVVLGALESVKSRAATKPAPVAITEPAAKPAPVMTVLDEPPTEKEAPPKIRPAPSADLDGAKYLPPSGNPPKVKFLHCDQTIQATYPKALRHSGFNCTVTKGNDVTEEAQLEMAHEEGRVLISQSCDYEILAAQGQKHAGILIIPRDAKAETFLAACRSIWSKARKNEGGAA